MNAPERRICDLIAKTHPTKVPEEGEHLAECYAKIADVIEDLQQTVQRLENEILESGERE